MTYSTKNDNTSTYLTLSISLSATGMLHGTCFRAPYSP